MPFVGDRKHCKEPEMVPACFDTLDEMDQERKDFHRGPCKANNIDLLEVVVVLEFPLWVFDPLA